MSICRLGMLEVNIGSSERTMAGSPGVINGASPRFTTSSWAQP
ncbi:MAG: hypothetical protein AB9873_13445 [Syntrophobacteraceae bacterium]